MNERKYGNSTEWEIIAERIEETHSFLCELYHNRQKLDTTTKTRVLTGRHEMFNGSLLVHLTNLYDIIELVGYVTL